MVNMVKAKLNGKYEIIIPEHRADRPEWYTKEGWEKERLDSMFENIHEDDIIYYIGAEEGEMPALCQMWGAKVVLFEPNPKAWSHIKAIWDANELKKPLGIFAGFASDKTLEAVNPEVNMTVSRGGWPLCAYEEIEAAHGFKELNKEHLHYNQIKIDDYVDVSKIIPDAISIDVEGAEGLVIVGAQDTIEKYHPKIWLSGHPEFMHDNYGGYLRELREWLKVAMKYDEELLAYDHEVHLYYHI